MSSKSPKPGRPSMRQLDRRGKGAWFFTRVEDQSRKKRLQIEQLEDRTLLTTFGPIDATPVPILIGSVKPDQTIVLTVDFTTTDPNDPLEDEPLIIQPSVGSPITIADYGTQQVQVHIAAVNETLTAYVKGGDDDEQAMIQVGAIVNVEKVSTPDSKSLTVEYNVQNNDLGAKFSINVYRSPDSEYEEADPNQIPIANLTITEGNATNGDHTIHVGTTGSSYQFSEYQALRPDPANAQLNDPGHENVIVTADDNGVLDPDDQTDPSQQYFHIYLVGIITHGFIGEPLPALGLSNPTYQDWLDGYAQSLQSTGGYDLGIAFHWETMADNPSTNYGMYTQAVGYYSDGSKLEFPRIYQFPGENTVEAAGNGMLTDVLQAAKTLSLGKNDVVDVNFIGWSRGGDVVSQALQNLNRVSGAYPYLNAGFMMQTMVDPHPANNYISQYSSPTYTGAQGYYDWLASLPIVARYKAFQSQTEDPNVVVPSNVQAAADFYQHTPSSEFTVYTPESLLNLWGLAPSSITSSIDVLPYDETAPGIGHTEVFRQVYQQVIDTGQTLTALLLPPFSADPLVVTTQPPANVTAGSPFGMVVTAENSDGTVNTSFNGSVTVANNGFYGGTLGGTTTVNAVNGVATFNGLVLTQATSSVQLYVNSPGLSVYTHNFSVAAAAATQLVVVSPGGPYLVGSPIGVTVDANDPYGNIDTNYSGSVTLALAANPGGATLGGTVTVNAVKGVATFSGVTVSAPGVGYTLKATANALTVGVSSTFTVEDKLVVTTQPPATVTAGATFTVVATVEDGLGNVVSSYSGPVIVSDYYGYTLGGTRTVNAVNGVATFTGLTLTEVTSYDELEVTASGIKFAYTNTFSVVAAAATQLVVVSPSGPYLVGSPFRVTVDAEDPYGNLATTYSGSVSLALAANPGGATLGGTVTVNASNGVATFTGVTVSAPGVGYTLKATASGLTVGVSSAFTVEDQLAITTQPPATVTAGSAFTFAASVEDGLGNVVTSYSGPVTVSDYYGYTLGGTRTVNAVNGVATFTGLTLTEVTSYDELEVTASGIKFAYTNTFSVVAAAATQLVVVSPSGPYLVGSPFRVTVDAEDAQGNLATNYSGSVTIALVANPGGAALGGTVTATAVKGVATFTGVTISAPGVGYTLKATASGLTAGVSSAFTVEDQLAITTQPPATVTAGSAFTFAASVEDGLGNVVASYNGPVTVAVYEGYTLGGTRTVNAVNGVATFSGLTLTEVTSDEELSVSASGLQGAYTNYISVVAASATQLVVVSPYGPFLTNSPFSVTVDAEDPYGNLATTYGGSVSLALAANPGGATLGGTVTATAVKGVATFSGVTVSTPGVGYTLKATASGLTAGVSSTFTIEDQLVVTTEPPATVIAGAAFTVAATVEDGLGNIFTSYSGPVTVSDYEGYTLGGTRTVNAVNGVATFTGLKLSTVTNYDELYVSASGLQTAYSNTFSVTVAVPSQLVVVSPSGPYLVGSPFRVTVDAEDPYGNLATTYSGSVTLALAANPGGAALGGTVTVTASGGVATFSGVTVSAPGVGYTLKATASGLTAGVSSTFTVEDQLAIITEPPATVIAGAAFTVAATVEDGLGNIVTSYSGPVTIADYEGYPLGGTTTVNAVNGVATFSGLKLTDVTSDDELDVSASGLKGAYTNTFSVMAAVASKLVVVSPGGPFLANAPFRVTVDVEDVNGNLATTYSGTITLALAANPGGATLGGTITVTAANGVATFSGVTLSTPGVGYTLKATASGLTAGVSSAFTVEDQLVVTTEPPATVIAGAAFTVAATVEDGLGNVFTSYNGPVTVADYEGYPLGGTTTVNAVNGVATFSGLKLTEVTSGDELYVSASGLQGAYTNTFSVVAAVASQLVVVSPGGPFLVGKPFGVTVDVEDVNGNLATTYSGTITLALAANPGGATLGGTITVTAANGVATFSGVTLSTPGVGYTLKATASGLTAGVSSAFTVEDQLVVTTEPPATVIAGAAFTVAATVEDGLGNVFTSYNGPVTVADYEGYPLGGTTTVNAVNGVATFSGLKLTEVTSGDELYVSASGLQGAYTNTFSVVAAVASQLVVVSPGGPFLVGKPFGVTVDVEDVNGNLATTYSGTITLALAANPGGATLGGTITVTAANGVATFSGVTLSTPGVGYTLKATASGLTAGVSSAFTVEDQLVVTTEPPATVIAGAAFTVAATVEDGLGNVFTSYNGPVTVADYEGYPLGGTTTVNAVNGVATFSGLKLIHATGDDELYLSGSGLQSAYTNTFSVAAATPSQLAVVPPSGPFLTNAPFIVMVDAEDPYGNLATNYSGNVTLALAANPGGATLGGTVTVNAFNGLATFTGVTVSAPGVGYTLKATASGLTAGVSSTFTVDDLFAITTEPPATVIAGAAFTVAATVEDGLGNVVTSYNGPVTIADYEGYTLGGTKTVNAVNGVATFSGLTLTEITGNDELYVNASGMKDAYTNTFSVAVAVPSQLVVATSSGPFLVGSPFRVTVDAEDANGNLATTYSGSVTLALAANPGGATLGGTITVNAFNGLATFTGVTVNAPGVGYTLKATASGLTAGVSSTFKVEDQLVITTEPPATVTAGATFTVAATVEDRLGNVFTSYDGPVTITNYEGYTLVGVKTVNAVNGVATFSGLTLTRATGYEGLSVSASGLQGAYTNTFGVTAAAASQLAVVPPNGPFLVGSPFGITVDAEDPYGNLVTNYSGSVTLALAANPGGATLGGTVTVNAFNGLATFTGATVSSPGVGYTLKATASGLTAGVSSAFTVEDQLVVTVEPPTSVTAGASFTVAATVEDGLGNVVTSYNGPVTIADYEGYTLGGTKTVNAVNGVATFSGLALTQATGDDELYVSASRLRDADTNTFSVVAAAATQLVVVPFNGPFLVGSPFSVTVDAKDPYGNLVTNYSGTVTLAMAANPGGATLGGTVTVNAFNGVATFTGVTVSAPGVGYTLKATASGLTSGVSSAFTVEDQLVITTEPPTSVTAGASFTVAASVEDGLGNVVTSYSGPVTIADYEGYTLGGTKTVNAVNGVATFSGLSSTLAETHTLVVKASGLHTSSLDVVISAGAATQLVFDGPSGTGPDNVVSSPFYLEVDADDAYGNMDPTFDGSVSVALSTNPSGATLGGPQTATAVDGQANFSGLTIDKLGTGYVLQATGGGLSKAFSPAFSRTDQLVVTTAPPSSVVAGATFGLVVEAQADTGVPDASFNGYVTIAMNSLTGGFTNALQGTLTVAAVNGVAVFSGLSVNQSGSDGLKISGNGLSEAFTLFNVTSAVASQLVVTTSPRATVTAGAPFALTVAAEDSLGNIDPAFFGNVTLSLANNPGGATLGGTLTVTISKGVATFTGVTVSGAGTGYTITATAAGLTAATTTAFAVTARGVATQLVVTAEPPAALAAGSTFGLVVKAEDDFGTVDATFHGAVTIADGDGSTLGGTTTVNAVNGVATFSGLTLTQATGSDDLTLAASGLASATTNQLTVTAAAATQLVVSSPAADVLAGAPFSLTVDAEDPYGNIDPTYSGTVTLALANNAGGATLGGTVSVTAVNGVASFVGLSLGKAGTGYTITATGGGLAAGTSPAFAVTQDQLVVTTQPSVGAAGAPFGLVVSAENASGAVDTSFSGVVTVALIDYTGGNPTLGGTLTATAVNGVVTFTGLSVNQGGTYALTVSSGGVGGMVTNTFTATSVAASQLVVTAPPPAAVTAGSPFALTVSAEDPLGNVDTTFSGTITLSLANNPGGATLGGSITATAVDGVATFTGVTVSGAGTGYTITATAAGLTAATTTAFAVTARGVATQLVVTAEPPAALAAGSTFGLVVKAEDDFGTVDATFHGAVTLTLGANPYGASLAGTVSVNAINGVATFSGISLFQAGTYTLSVGGNGLVGTTTNTLYVNPAAATQLVVLGPNGSVLTGSPFSLEVDAEDSFGQVDPTFNGSITLSLHNNTGGSLGGTLTATAIDGVATFSNLSLSQAGGGDSIQATGDGLTYGLSELFDVENDQLVVTTPPASEVAAGGSFGFVVSAETGSGSVDTSFNGSVTVALGDFYIDSTSTLAGVLTVTAVNGVATFSGLSVGQAGFDGLVILSNGLAGTFAPITVTSVAASQLVVTAPPPAAVTAGSPFALTVSAEDPLGNVDTTFSGTITLSLANNPGGATLGGTLTVTISKGVATFTGVTVSGAGTGYTITATAAGLTAATTTAFAVTARGVATQLVVTAEPPAALAAGSTFGLVVKAEDDFGTVDATFHGAVTIADGDGSTLGGTTTVNAVNGVATFSGLTLTQATGSDDLTLAASGLASATTNQLTVTAAAATQLVVSSPAADVLAGAPFSLTVDAEDPYGNIDPTYSGTVTLALANNAGGATLGGTVSVTAVNGVASFVGLSLGKAGTGYTITATGGGLAAGTSPAFAVTQDQLVVTTQPSVGAAGAPFGLVVSAENASGAVDTSFSGVVTVALIDYTGGNPTLGGTLTATAVNGVVTFSNLTIDQQGTYALLTIGYQIGDGVSEPIQVTGLADDNRPTATLATITGPRNIPVSSEDVTFSEPIDTSTLTYQDLSLNLNGGPNLITSAVSFTLVSGNSYQINGLSGLTTTEGTYTLTFNEAEIEAQNGLTGIGSISTSWLMDTTAPISQVMNTLGTSQTSDTFPVIVSFADPSGPGGATPSGVTSLDLYVSVNNGPFRLYQTANFAPSASGTETFMFTGQDRDLYAFHSVAHDVTGNVENKAANAIEATTSVPDLNPPVTHIQNTSSYSQGVFTINWAGTDPDQNSGTPSGSIVTVDIYVKIDGGAPILIAQAPAGTPNGSVYSGTLSYDALADNQSHTYGFFSIGIDDQQKSQAVPNSPDVTFSNITYSAPLTAQPITVEKGIVGRSFIEYLDVNFNQTASSDPALQALASGLAGATPNSYVELLWYGENLTTSSLPQGSVNLFGNGTTASVTLNGNDLSINFGSNGITSLLTENGVSGTGSPSKTFGDGWYALGIDPTGNPSNGQVFWESFYRLLGNTNGTGVVTGPFTTPGTDAYNVYHAEGQSNTLLSTDVDGNGVVNSKDFSEAVLAKGDSVGSVAPMNFPQFQLFAGSSTQTNAVAATQAQVQALLPVAIEAWAAAGLDAADVGKLEAVEVQVANLGTSILGLEAANTILINQTAAGQGWYLGVASTQTFGLTGPGGESLAGPGSPAAAQVDFLTVLEHELGHVIGLPDNNTAGDLMDITLGAGVSRTPSASDLAALAQNQGTSMTVPVTVPVSNGSTMMLQTGLPTPIDRRSANGPGHPFSLSGRSAAQAIVDAALASLLGSAGETGDEMVPGIQGVLPASPATSALAVEVTTTRRNRIPQAPGSSALRLVPSPSIRNNPRPTQSAPSGPASSAEVGGA